MKCLSKEKGITTVFQTENLKLSVNMNKELEI